ncbi:MAG TPA: HD domain-containing phosphohydrolase [Armatimonadota bacterium]|jgi:putative nucleotidyltransferase with HDIG domain
MAGASALIQRAADAVAVVRVLLEAAADFGASAPRAGLWRSEDGAYSMWRLDASGATVTCGSAPASLYAGAMVMEDDSQLVGAQIPIAGPERRFGVLDVGGQISDGAALSALAILARQAATRLEAADASDAAPQPIGILDACEAWWSASGADALLAQAVADTARLCGADSCAVALLDADTGQPRLLFSEDVAASSEMPHVLQGFADRPYAPHPHGFVPTRPLGWKAPNDQRRNPEAILSVLRTAEPLAFRWSPTTEALKAGLLPAGPAEGSWAAYPLTDAGEVIGLIDVYSRQPRRFGPEQDAVLAQAARALARIFVQMNKDGRDLADRARQDVLSRLSVRLADVTDLKEVSSALVGAARTLWPDADLLYTMLPQVEGGLWQIAALESTRPNDPRHGWARSGEGFAGWVIQSRQPLVLSAAADDPRRGPLDRGQGIEAGAWAPMQRGQTMLGLLAVGSFHKGQTLNAVDMELLERLAELGAVALERARERHGTQAAFWDAIEAISAAIDARDGYTHGHSRNVTEYAVAISNRLGLPFGDTQTVRAAALMHDIGKIGIPDHILNKPGQLTADERTVMESHSEVGYEILSRAPSLQPLLPGVRYHHERPDGAGYPLGLSGGALPLHARIIAVADAFDAMTSDRVYRKRMTIEKAVSILKEGAGAQWDPQCVEHFVSIVDERATPRLQLLAAEDSGRQYLPSLGTDVFGA